MIRRFAIKGYWAGFWFSVVGHILMFLTGQSGIFDAAINAVVSGLLIWGPLGAIIGAVIGAAWRLLHPRPTSLPPG